MLNVCIMTAAPGRSNTKGQARIQTCSDFTEREQIFWADFRPHPGSSTTVFRFGYSARTLNVVPEPEVWVAPSGTDGAMVLSVVA